MNKTVVCLQKNLVVLPDENQSNEKFAATVQSHLMQWGYILSKEAFEQLAQCDKMTIVDFHIESLDYIRAVTGGKHDYTPLYPGFPDQVMDSSSLTLFLIAQTQYWTGGLWKPAAEKKEFKFEHEQFKVLQKGSEEDYLNIFKELVSINTSLTPEDQEVVNWFIKNEPNLELPDKIPFKETLCMLAGARLDVPVSTPTDVLRIASYLSGGDSSLSPVPPKGHPMRSAYKFKKFNRKDRRYLLSLLEQTHCDPREMVLKRERWLRLGEILHPGEYKAKYPNSFTAFDKLRNQRVKSWYSEVEQAFDKSFEQGLKKLAERPGEFARKIDYLIRENLGKSEVIIQMFTDGSKATSNKVLFEVYQHFETRKTPVRNRTVSPKGTRKVIQLPDLAAIPEVYINKIQSEIRTTLSEKFKQLDSLGKTWIDPELKKVPMPHDMRSSSFSLKPVIRGQRLPINDTAKVVRAFVHWFNDETTPHGCDIDLSGFLFNEDGSKVEHIGWNGEHNYKRACVYSGDVRGRKGACAEYIDFDVEELVKLGWKYGVIDIRDFESNPKGILDYTDCVFGIMERSQPRANTTWKPNTIENSHFISSASTAVVVAAIDLETREYFMIDRDAAGNVASKNISEVFRIMKSSGHPPSFSVYDLLSLHANARGSIVKESEADTVFSLEDFMHSYEKTAHYMGV